MWEGTQSSLGGIVEGPGNKVRYGLNTSPCDASQILAHISLPGP